MHKTTDGQFTVASMPRRNGVNIRSLHQPTVSRSIASESERWQLLLIFIACLSIEDEACDVTTKEPTSVIGRDDEGAYIGER